MFTRADVVRRYSADHTANPSPAAAADAAARTPGLLVIGSGAPLMLPPPVVAMDPSDPSTWPTPAMRFTT